MLKCKLGPSRKKKFPVLYILGRTYLLHEGLIVLWNFRRLKEIDRNKEFTILEFEGQTLKFPNEYAWLIIDEWKMWKKYYIPHFSLHGKTVLDVGAGCGETALLFFLHGAYKVIAVEPNVKAIEYLKENAERNNWNVEIVAEPFSLEHLKLNYDFMKMDGEGCEELLLSLPRLDKPCVVEVHGKELLNRFIEKRWLKIHSVTEDAHLITLPINRDPTIAIEDSIYRKVEFFFNSLTEEKENFAPSLSNVLQCKLLVTEEEKERIIGIAGLRGKNMFFLLVKKEYQNWGIGQKLTRKVIQKATLSKYDFIALNVFQSNTKAIHIYQKLGFKTVYASLVHGRKNLFMILPLNWRAIILVARCKVKSLYLIGTIIYKIVRNIRIVMHAATKMR